MKRVFNWTFGSIFRTFGRIIAYLTVGLILGLILSKNNIKITDLIGIYRVNASSLPSWVTNSYITMPTVFNFSECGSSSCSNITLDDNFVKDDSNDVYYFNGNASAITIGANGYMLSHNTDSLLENYMYSYQIFFCSNKALSFDDVTYTPYIGASAADIRNFVNNKKYLSDVYGGAISNIPADNGGASGFNYCYAYRYIFSPSKNSNWLGMRIRRKSSNISGAYVYFFGYKLDSLGLYDDYIKQVIEDSISSNTSGLATSSQLQQTEQNIVQEQQNTTDAVNDLNDSINDDDSSGAQSEASDFFNSFTTNTHGLTGIITAPLNAIQSLTSKTCIPLVLPLPFVNQNLTLPCMREIYVQNFGGFMNIYDVITLGIISYWIMVRIFALVKDFKNPDHDEIEVVDL